MANVKVGTHRPTTELQHMVYTGPVQSLRGKTALVSKNEQGQLVAQFDDRNTGYGYGWHYVPGTWKAAS